MRRPRSAAFRDSLPDVTRLVALMHPGFIGETMVLLAELEDGHLRWIEEHDEHWNDALAALDKDGRTVTNSTCWMLQLMGDETRTPIDLFVR